MKLKRYLSLFLVICMVLSFFPAAAFADEELFEEEEIFVSNDGVIPEEELIEDENTDDYDPYGEDAPPAQGDDGVILVDADDAQESGGEATEEELVEEPASEGDDAAANAPAVPGATPTAEEPFENSAEDEAVSNDGDVFPGLYVGGEQVPTTGPITPSGASGSVTAFYVGDTTIKLQLNNFSYNGAGYHEGYGNAPIWYEGEKNLIIELIGVNSLTNNDDDLASKTQPGYGIYYSGYSDNSTLTINGGTLDIGFDAVSSHGKLDAIFAEADDLFLSDVTVNATGGVAAESIGIYVSGDVTVTGATVNATGVNTTSFESRGIYCRTLTVNSGDVTALASSASYDAFGVQAYDVKLNSGTLAASGVSGNALASGKGITGNVAVTGGEFAAYGSSRAIQRISGSVPSGYTVKAGQDSASATQIDPASADFSSYQYVSITSGGDTPTTAHTHTDSQGRVVVFQPWTDSTRLPTSGGSYYLTCDVTLTDGGWYVPGTVDLCLNGKTITGQVHVYPGFADSYTATLNLYDCAGGGKITGAGAAVTVHGTFNMYGGNISGNLSGVAVTGNDTYNGAFNMYGGTITGNTNFGVSVGNGTFTVSGSVDITENGGPNVLLTNGKTIGVSADLSSESRIGVTTMEDVPVTFTSGASSLSEAAMLKVFSSDNSDYVVGKGSDGEGQLATPVAEIGETKYSSLTAAINAVPDDTQTTIKLLRDITVTRTVEIPGAKNIVLDLAGHTITGPDTVIKNEGTLTINANGESGADGGITTSGVCAVSNWGYLTVFEGTYKSTLTEDPQSSMGHGLFEYSFSSHGDEYGISNIVAVSRHTVFYSTSYSRINVGASIVTKDASSSEYASPIFYANSGSSIYVSGGEYTSKDAKYSLFYGYGAIHVTNGSFTQVNDSVSLIDCSNVTISGGGFRAYDLAASRAGIEISGGMFSDALGTDIAAKPEFVADGYALYDSPDEEYPWTVLPAGKYFRVGDEYFENFGDTKIYAEGLGGIVEIDMLADYSESATYIFDDDDTAIILDLNGHTYTITNNYFFAVDGNGNFTLKDSADDEHKGMLTGETGTTMRAIRGTFTLDGARIESWSPFCVYLATVYLKSGEIKSINYGRTWPLMINFLDSDSFPGNPYGPTIYIDDAVLNAADNPMGEQIFVKRESTNFSVYAKSNAYKAYNPYYKPMAWESISDPVYSYRLLVVDSGSVASVTVDGGTPVMYGNLSDAFAAASAASGPNKSVVVSLLADVGESTAPSAVYEIPGPANSIIFNLNGHMLYGCLELGQDLDVTVCDNVGTGKISGDTCVAISSGNVDFTLASGTLEITESAGIYLSGTNSTVSMSDGSIQLESGMTTTSVKIYGISVFQGAAGVDITGGTIDLVTNAPAGVETYGVYDDSSAAENTIGGTPGPEIKAVTNAVYIGSEYSNGSCTIMGGNLSAAEGIDFQRGTLNISGSTITATNGSALHVNHENGHVTEVKLSGIPVLNASDDNSQIKITPDSRDLENIIIPTVYSGTNSYTVTDGYAWGTVSGGDYSYKLDKAIARINGILYANLSEAFTAAQAASIAVVELLDNVTESASYTISTGTVILDLNGFTYTNTAASGAVFTTTGEGEASSEFLVYDDSENSDPPTNSGKIICENGATLFSVSGSGEFGILSGRFDCGTNADANILEIIGDDTTVEIYGGAYEGHYTQIADHPADGFAMQDVPGSDGYYHVVRVDPVARIEIGGEQAGNYTSLAAAIAAVPADATPDTVVISMIADSVEKTTVKTNRSFTLDLEGHAVQWSTGSSAAPITLKSGSSVTVIGSSGSMLNTGHGIFQVQSGAALNLIGGEYIANNYTLDNRGGVLETSRDATIYAASYDKDGDEVTVSYSSDNFDAVHVEGGSVTLEDTSLYAYQNAIYLYNNRVTSTVTFDRGVIEAKATAGGYYAVNIGGSKDSTFAFKAGEIKSGARAIDVHSGSLTIEDGTIQATDSGSAYNYEVLVVFENGSTVITGGAFQLTNGSYDKIHDQIGKYLAEGYILSEVATGDYYPVVPDPGAVVSVQYGEGPVCYYKTLDEAWAVANAESGATMTLRKNVNTGMSFDSTKATTLDLNGKTYIYNGSESDHAIGVTAGSLTIKDGASGGKLNAIGSYGVLVTGGSFTLESGTIEATLSRYSAVFVTGGSVNIEGGTLETSDTDVLTVENHSDGADKANVVITGGTLTLTKTPGKDGPFQIASNYKYPATDLGDVKVVSNTKPTLTHFNGQDWFEAAEGGDTVYCLKPSYTVTFNADGGTPTPDAQTNQMGTKVKKPDNPTKVGCNFLAWYLDGAPFDFDNTVPTEDITLVAKWETQERYARIYMSIELVDSFGINTYVEPLTKGSDRTIDKYSVSYKFGDGDEWTTMALTDGTRIGRAYYLFSPASCLSTEMTLPLSFRVLYNESGEDKVVAEVMDYSIRTYCLTMIETGEKPDATDADKKLADLCQAVIDYGGSAQILFEDPNPLANEGHDKTAYLPAIPDATDPEGEKWTPARDGTNDNVGKIYASLALNSKTEINIYLLPSSKKAIDKIDPASISVSRIVNGSPQPWDTFVTQKTKTYVLVSIQGITSTDLQDMFCVTVPDGDTNALTFDYSPMSYAQSQQSDESMTKVCRALYNYSVKARNYWSN